jgi:hypothetical protein
VLEIFLADHDKERGDLEDCLGACLYTVGAAVPLHSTGGTATASTVVTATVQLSVFDHEVI